MKTQTTQRKLILGAGALVAALVFLLSLRLRRREIETIVKIGGARSHVAAVLVAEIVVVLLASLVLAAILTGLTSAWGAEAIRLFLR